MAISTVVFDAYGTLFDVGAAPPEMTSPGNLSDLATYWPALSADWRDRQLRYSWQRSLMHLHADFDRVTADALDWALERHDLDPGRLRDPLLAQWHQPPVFADAAPCLAALKAAGLATAILSNGTPAMLESAITAAGLNATLDAVLSVEEAGAFKPAPEVYDLVDARFGRPRGEVLFVSANGWDIAGAAAHGFRTCWINRRAEPAERLPGRIDLTLPDLAKVPTLARDLLRTRRDSAARIGETRWFTSPDGLSLAYRDDGRHDGPVLLCLAGLTRNLADFDFVARDFADRARILRLDTRGRGQSDWDPDYRNYNLIRESRDAIALLDHLGIEKAAILGTSRGGLIAMNLASGYHDRLSGVCLNDIGPEIEAAGLAHIATYLGLRPAEPDYAAATGRLTRANAAAFPGVPAERWRLHAERLYREAPGGLDLRYDAMLRKAVFEQAATGVAPDLWPLFDHMTDLPVALIRGANSDILAERTAMEMQRRRPDLILGVVPDRGHVPFLDEPVARQVIARFLERLT